jgi:hypothetical protein
MTVLWKPVNGAVRMGRMDGIKEFTHRLMKWMRQTA